VDFETLLAQFRTEEEINQFEIQDLLNVDFEKLEELKEKVTEYSQTTSDLINATLDDRNEDLLVFFCEKLNDLKRNEINIQTFINNVEKVDGLCFSNNKIEIYLKK
jgi:hypothetical protein